MVPRCVYRRGLCSIKGVYGVCAGLARTRASTHVVQGCRPLAVGLHEIYRGDLLVLYR